MRVERLPLSAVSESSVCVCVCVCACVRACVRACVSEEREGWGVKVNISESEQGEMELT